MKRLIVYLNSQTVGTLEQDDNGLLKFRYDQQWLVRPDALAISRSLPLRADAFTGNAVRPFFAGILPEEGPRQQIASLLGISERNDFAMLERIGGECAGAVMLLPEGTHPPDPDQRRMRKLSESELEDVIKQLHHRPLLAGQDDVRLSLAGAQDKLPVVMIESTIAVPLGNTPSTHIIKPEPPRFPGLVDVELFCMTLAKSVGLNVPAVSSRQIAGIECIIIQRYDRALDAQGRPVRIHQEDFCQAMGFPPERKYQQEGGPLLRDCIAMLRQWSTAPVLDIRDFLDALIFNVLIANADAHGKNYSLLYANGQRRLAPLYDLVCTLAWPELSKTPAMKIGQGDSIEIVTSSQWQKMTKESSLGWPMVRERIAELCEKTIDVLSNTIIQKIAANSQASGRVAEIIGQRSSAMLARLS